MLIWMIIATLFTTLSASRIQSSDERYISTDCLSVGGLSKQQRSACRAAPPAGSAALQGLRAAVDECRFQMRRHRWDCSPLKHRASNPHASPMMSRGYKETAFVHALTSAAVAKQVSRDCARGLIMACGCDPSSYRPGGPEPTSSGSFPKPASRWKWGGCSHNIEYGMKFSKTFLDSRETAGDLHSKVNQHNNEAGRLVVANNMEIKCKCHGLSGSCQVRTCWRAAPPLRVVGKVLRKKYKTALIVGRSNTGRPAENRIKNRRRGMNRNRRWKPYKNQPKLENAPKDSLIYYEPSPSYCDRDYSHDIYGTAGRRCSRNPSSPGSCGALCCGRGHDLVRKQLSQRCRCKFHWCCVVECDTCKREEWVAVCK